MAKHNTIGAIESVEVAAAYGAIEDFYTAWGLRHGLKQLNKTLASAMSRKASKDASNVIYFFKTLKNFIHAALLIQQSGYKRENAILTPPEDGLPDLSCYKDYCGMYTSCLWLAFPRSLSKKEYFNPYLVFKKVGRYACEKDWNFIVDELQDFTFYKSSFSECGEEHNILKLHCLLQKLIEGGYLVFTRTIKTSWWEGNKLIQTENKQTQVSSNAAIEEETLKVSPEGGDLEGASEGAKPLSALDS